MSKTIPCQVCGCNTCHLDFLKEDEEMPCWGKIEPFLGDDGEMLHYCEGHYWMSEGIYTSEKKGKDN